MGFRSRSELLTAIAERMRLCGLSAVGCFRLALQLQERIQERDPKGYKQAGFDFSILRPLPPLPESEPVSSETLQFAVKELQQELKRGAMTA